VPTERFIGKTCDATAPRVKVAYFHPGRKRPTLFHRAIVGKKWPRFDSGYEALGHPDPLHL
jgi:hypothetical protein